MFFNGINDFESKFKLFDRLNLLVFNVWRDKKAIAYRDSDIARITNEWRNYVSRARSLSEEANMMERGLDRKLSEIESIMSKLVSLAANPQIRNCGIYEAYGTTQEYHDDGSPGREFSTKQVRFVAKQGNEKNYAAGLVGSCDQIHVRAVKTPL